MVNITVLNDDDEHDRENDWIELMGDDLMMQVVGGGKGDQIEPKEAVLVTFEGRVADNRSIKNGSLFQRFESLLIVVGDSDVLPALDMGIRHMKAGQTAFIWSHSKYALGNGTRTIIAEKGTDTNAPEELPPNSNVMYKVTVTQKVMDTSRLNPYFTIQKALTKKKIANDIYTNEWCKPPETNKDANCDHSMKRAVRLYTKAANEMQTLLQGTYFNHVEKDHPQRKESRQILLDSLNNIVAVHLKQQEYHKAKQSSVEVLKVDPGNVKALLRAAKAALMDPASTMEEASEAMKAAESEITSGRNNNSTNEKQLKRLKILLKEKQLDYKEKSKEMFGNKLSSKSSASAEITEPAELSTKEKNSENLFGESQAYNIILQITIPLLVMFLVKYLFDNYGPIEI